MLTVRRASERGPSNLGWLQSQHTFSFGHYHDPRHMGFRDLRVINEDKVKPGMGFGTHGHADMEIVSYVIDGALAHKDSIGTGSIIRPGEIQRMSAGRGISHSEFNASQQDPVHFLQIWILPDRHGIEPSYEQKTLPERTGQPQLDLIASPDGGEHAVTLHQDVRIHRALLDEGQSVEVPLRPDRHAWVQVVNGALEVNGTRLEAGDGAAISREEILRLAGIEATEALVFDLN